VQRIAEEAVAKVQSSAGSDQAVKQLRDEIDQLKKQNQTLMSRLESLEAKASKYEAWDKGDNGDLVDNNNSQLTTIS
ncbi:hypothetical protein C7B79_34820, partial [Chroococcidiopsis cubana CCALA 043]|uniref:hypothetical protein n=1 Tax=Chroococcidiopsis cubana TaxID=171392 RepID=UPI000D41A907